jgi:hypothetical protein
MSVGGLMTLTIIITRAQISFDDPLVLDSGLKGDEAQQVSQSMMRDCIFSWAMTMTLLPQTLATNAAHSAPVYDMIRKSIGNVSYAALVGNGGVMFVLLCF